ncbi:MAG: hypothetical protein Q8Q56_03255 [Alphaproteobacteria bacterium]|nr:hypothetical protein [Alphaproteobacteria bacterium]
MLKNQPEYAHAFLIDCKDSARRGWLIEAMSEKQKQLIVFYIKNYFTNPFKNGINNPSLRGRLAQR